MPIVSRSPEEHRIHVVSDLRAFADLVESQSEPISLLLPLRNARRALSRFEDHLRSEAGLLGDWTCLHCGKPYREDYMVHDSVWREAVPDVHERHVQQMVQGLPKGGLVLHLRCLEARLERPLTVNDLSPAPVNDAIRYFLGVARRT